MEPKVLAKWLSEDIRGRTGYITEDLFGFRVQPGDSQVDKLINYIDNAYIDWNPQDPKFQAAVKKVLGSIPQPSQWGDLIAQSSQSPELKQMLAKLMGGGTIQGRINQSQQPSKTAQMSQQTPQAGGQAGQVGKFPTGTGLFEVHFHRGTVVKCNAFLPSNNSPMTYYMGIGTPSARGMVTWVRGGRGVNNKGRPPQMYRRLNNKEMRTMGLSTRSPRGFSKARGMWAYPKFLTCNVKNVAKVVKIK